MAFQYVCSTDDLWEGEMAVFQVGDRDVLLLRSVMLAAGSDGVPSSMMA